MFSPEMLANLETLDALDLLDPVDSPELPTGEILLNQNQETVLDPEALAVPDKLDLADPLEPPESPEHLETMESPVCPIIFHRSSICFRKQGNSWPSWSCWTSWKPWNSRRTWIRGQAWLRCCLLPLPCSQYLLCSRLGPGWIRNKSFCLFDIVLSLQASFVDHWLL